MTPLKQQIVDFVNAIPHGRVTNYGTISKMIRIVYGKEVTAQLVGWQLSGMNTEEQGLCAWWRVVNKQGFISTVKLGERGQRQIQHLIDEGVIIKDLEIDMEVYGWYYPEVL